MHYIVYASLRFAAASVARDNFDMTSTATLAAILDEMIDIISPASPTPRLDAEVLLAYVTGATRAEIIARRVRDLTPSESDKLTHLVERRRRGEPIAYLSDGANSARST